METRAQLNSEKQQQELQRLEGTFFHVLGLFKEYLNELTVGLNESDISSLQTDIPTIVRNIIPCPPVKPPSLKRFEDMPEEIVDLIISEYDSKNYSAILPGLNPSVGIFCQMIQIVEDIYQIDYNSGHRHREIAYTLMTNDLLILFCMHALADGEHGFAAAFWDCKVFNKLDDRKYQEEFLRAAFKFKFDPP